MSKIVSKQEFIKIRESKGEKKIVLCHGVFDVVHPGHMVHFKEAKSLGDLLVVSVTASKYVRKGPDRPYFNNQMRLNFLERIDLIDFVILSESYTANDIIEIVKPDVYVKGKEYSDSENDITGMIDSEVELVRKYGGDVYYTDGAVFSSTKIINSYFHGLPLKEKQYVQEHNSILNMNIIKKYVNQISNLRILVVGEAIIDKYTYCRISGLMSKDLGYSAIRDYTESYLGGAFAIARNVREFSENVTLATIMGCEKIYRDKVKKLSEMLNLEIEYCESYETIVKHKYVENMGDGNKLHKIFSINNANEKNTISQLSFNNFVTRLNNKINEYDLVILCDYGHGLIVDRVKEILETNSKILVVNCQTNSSNYGRNLLSKYKRIDAFSINEKELKLICTNALHPLEVSLYELCRKYNSSGWLTCGEKGAYGVEKNGIKTFSPGLNNRVTDTIGAGDAFFAVSSLFFAVKAPIVLSTFMGNVAGSLATGIANNREPIYKTNILKYASTILNI